MATQLLMVRQHFLLFLAAIALQAIGLGTTLPGTQSSTATFGSGPADHEPARSRVVAQDSIGTRALSAPSMRPRGAGFLANRGQWKTDAQFVGRLPGMQLRAEPGALGVQVFERPDDSSRGVYMRWVFEGASPACVLVPEDPSEAVYNWYLGNDASKWASGIPSAARLRWHGLYEGIDFVVREERGGLKFDIEVEPWADLAQVRIRCEGTEQVEVDGNGVLALSTAIGCFTQEPALTCQVLGDGRLQPVTCSYRVLDAGTTFGFQVEGRDPSTPLWIDPPLLWSTYFGGGAATQGGADFAWAIAMDRLGDVYVAGDAAAIVFPTTPGAYHHPGGVGNDCFAAKFRGSDGALVYSSVFGGADYQERAWAIDVDRDGKAVVGGQTGSLDFPVTPGAYDTTYQSILRAGFVLELSPDAGQLLWSTFLMGDAPALVTDIAIDRDGAPIVVGNTDVGFPTTPGAFDTTPNGYDEGFVSKLHPSGSRLLWSTYLGGNNTDELWAVEVDDQGYVTVAGRSGSPDFPTTPGAFSTGVAGGMDGAVARLSPNGDSLLWGTLIGGSQFEWLDGLGLAPDGGAVIAGATLSANYPLTASPASATPTQGYVTWINSTGTALIYSTYLGIPSEPGGAAAAWDLAIDRSGVVTVLANTFGMTMTPGGLDTTYNGGLDASVWRLSPSGNKFYYATYIGGSGEEYSTGVVATQSGRITITGRTLSSNYPTTPGAYSPTTNGGSEAFLTTFEPYLQGVEPYGEGTPSCHAALVTNATEMPQAGASTFGLYLGGAPSYSRGVCLIATAPGASGVPFFNTTLWLNPAAIMGRVAVFTDSLGFTETALPLTSVASGTQLWAQYFVRNSADCPDGRLAASQALHLTVQ